MRKIIAGAVIAALSLTSMGSAFAADAATVILTGGSKAVVNTMPDALVATLNSAGTVEYKADGKTIVGCEKVASTTVAPFKASCSWMATVAAPTNLTAVFTPTDTTVEPVTSAVVIAKVGQAVQGEVSPIHIYVDTVLASGSTGVLAPRFSACSIQSEYLLGQTIVFRIYANNADLGGAVMDNTNTAKAFIEVAGVANPITLSYGNHSGSAFWTAVLKTGTATGNYSTLGVINYKITMIGKDITTAKVLATRRVAKIVDGVKSYEYVSYYRTRNPTYPIKGATGVLAPYWAATTSMLTLYAPPAA
jgi:hypothetical protein